MMRPIWLNLALWSLIGSKYDSELRDQRPAIYLNRNRKYGGQLRSNHLTKRKFDLLGSDPVLDSSSFLRLFREIASFPQVTKNQIFESVSNFTNRKTV